MYKVSAQEQEAVGLKTTVLQLNCESKDVGRGFCPNSLNPHLPKLTRPPQLPVMGLHMMNTSERVNLQQTVSQHIVGLSPQRKSENQVQRREYMLPFGDKAVLNNRYLLPSCSGHVSPAKGVSSMVLQVAPLIAPHKTKTVHFTGATIQSRCSCRHHRWHNSEDHRTMTLGSGSNNEEHISLHVNRIRGFKNDTRVKPKDMSPPKKQTLTNGMSAIQLKNKSKRANVLASDSSSSIQVQVKLRKQSTTKIPSCAKYKSQTKEEQVTEKMKPERIQKLQTKPNPYMRIPHLIEVTSENHVNTRREPSEEMDVDLEDKEQLPAANSAEKLESIDSMSVRSSTDLRRIATPQLLKVNDEQKMMLLSLLQKFQKLDADCDGHISFTELEKSLPQGLTKRQINYIKKIYAFACESTYFGVEEFLATHQMCKLLTTSSNPLVLNALNSLDSYSLDSWLKTYRESFSKADTDHTGVLDVLSFQNMLASVMNVHPDSIILHNILGSLNKSKDDTISGVELLAYIPYLAAVAPRDT